MAGSDVARTFAACVSTGGESWTMTRTISLMLPIWIATRTHAPHWIVAAASAVNALVCVFLQTHIGAAVASASDGGRAFRRAGLLFLLSCPLIAASADTAHTTSGEVLAVLVIIAAVCVHSLGEIWQSSATLALGFGLAPDHAQGEYQGVLGLGFDAGQALAPVVLTTAFLGLGQAGWALLGLFFAGLGSLGPAVAQWAQRTAPRPFQESEA